MSDKIKPHHLERKAILYIRQFSAYQVSHNLESQKLQYAMQERLQQLGWREIEVVDEDLGRSAAGTVTRAQVRAPRCKRIVLILPDSISSRNDRTSYSGHPTGSGSFSEFPTPPWLHFVLAVPSTLGPGKASFRPSSPADSPNE